MCQVFLSEFLKLYLKFFIFTYFAWLWALENLLFAGFGAGFCLEFGLFEVSYCGIAREFVPLLPCAWLCLGFMLACLLRCCFARVILF
ncbi:MAG: hypothetical protein K2N12_07200 [Helicobacter sp.]|nr:hypothetical protein [Helicobacter sp.]